MYTQRRKNTTQFSSRKFNLNLESSPKKSKKSSNSHKYMLFLLLFVVALMGVAVTQTGLTGYVVGVQDWENTIVVTANTSIEILTIPITFGENKPEFCSDGIYIETQYNDEVEFSVENETYVNNTCRSCDVVFYNTIYEEEQLPPPPITTIPIPEEEPTPPEEEEEVTLPPITTLPPEEEPAEEEPPTEEQKGKEPTPPPLTALVIAQNEVTYHIYYGRIAEEPEVNITEEEPPELPPLKTMAGETINLDLIYPAGNINATQYEFFNVTANVTCLNDNCGEVNVSLVYKNWWNTSFARRKQIDITNIGSSTLTDFPVFLNVSYDSDMQLDYDDIRFINDFCSSTETAELDYEFVENDSYSGEFWVKIPTLASGTTSICMYYNNSQVSSGENASGVWSNNYVLVTHMKDNDSSSVLDSTQYSNNGTKGASEKPNETTGRIYHAQDFNSTSTDYISFGHDDEFDVTDAITLEIWAKPASVMGNGKIFGKNYGPYILKHTSNHLYFVLENTTDVDLYARLYDWLDSSKVDTWHHFVGTWDKNIDSGNIKLYVNGSEVNYDQQDSITDGLDVEADESVRIGYQSPNPYNGSLDEARISNVTRSSDWINMTYQVVQNQGSVVTWGSEEETSLVSTQTGATPFYTNESNPRNISLSQNEEETVVFWINTSSSTYGSIYGFFSYANQTSNMSVNNQTSEWNVTILSWDHDYPQFSSPAINESTIATNEYFCVNITITDGTSFIDTAYAEINNTTSLVNYTLSNSTSIANCGGGGNTWSAQIQATANGTWNYSKVWANDSVNNANSTDFEDINISVMPIDYCNGSTNVNLTEATVCDNLTIDLGMVYNTSIYDLTITNNLTINGTFLGGNGSHSIGGNLTIQDSGVFNASNGTTQITGNTLINGTWNTPNNAIINISNVTHNGTTNMGDYAIWHLYGEWAGVGTVNGYASPNKATIIAYNNSKIMGTLGGNGIYIYEFIIPEGEIAEKYGSEFFGAKNGKLEINGTYQFVSGDNALIVSSLETDIFIGPNANVSTVRVATFSTNTLPESTWYYIDADNGGTITLSGNLTVIRDDYRSHFYHYYNDSISALNLEGYSFIATGSSHDLYLGSPVRVGDEGYAGVVNMDGGSIIGFDDIIFYTKNSTINDTGAGLIEATDLFLSYGKITLNETIVNITGNSYINSTFTGGSGSHYLNNLTIDLDGEYAGAGNLTFTGTAQITNGSLNNFTITNMNNTRAWFYNSTDIQLHPWTTLPAGGSVNITNAAVNASNTSVNGNMSLRIYYSTEDISGLTEANLQIYRYNGSDWVNISSSVNETENYVWAEGITEFSEFGVGEVNGNFTWTNAGNTGIWENADNWDRSDYPKDNNDYAIFNATNVTNCNTTGAVTIGNLLLDTGYTGALNLSGNLTVDDAGAQDGKIDIVAGTIDANGYNVSVDAELTVTGTLTCGSGDHDFNINSGSGYAIHPNSGTFNGGSGTHTMHRSVYLQSSTVTLTSGIMNLTYSGGALLYALVTTGGTINHNNGTIEFSHPGTMRNRDTALNIARIFNNIIVSNPSTIVEFYEDGGYNITLDGNLTVAGEWRTSEVTSGKGWNLTIHGDTNISGTLNVSGGSIVNSSGNLDFAGTVIINNGSLNNFTITNMNNTRAWFYNSTDIQLHPWTTLPASSLVNITGKAVNISNTSISSYTDLNISYTASDISGLNESSLKIYRYNGTEWEEAGASTGVNTTNNYTWAKGITEFSEFALGGEEGIYISTQSGDWTDNNTWGASVGCYPQTGNNAIISDTHTVTINSSTAATVKLIIISTGGTLSMSAGSNLTFDDVSGCGFERIYGTLSMSGNSSDRITINSAGANNWTAWAGDSDYWYANYSNLNHFRGYYGGSTGLGGKTIFNNINITTSQSYLYYSLPDAYSTLTNSYIEGVNIYSTTIGQGDTYTFDNITLKSSADRFQLSTIRDNVIFNNIINERTASDALYLYTGIVNTTFNNLSNSGGVLINDGVNELDIKCHNCNISHSDGITFESEATYYRHLNFNNSNFTAVTDWNLITTPNSYIASENHNSVANSWHGWFYSCNLSTVRSEYRFGSNDNVTIREGNLSADINAQMYTLNVTSGTEYKVINNSITEGYQVIDMSGNITIINGSLNNFTITNMNNTRAWFYDSIDIQLHPWTALPAGGSVDIISRAVNASNTSVNGNMSLRIYYSTDDISGLTEANLQIFRYNGSDWVNISSTVDEANNFVYSEGVTEFSEFAIGEEAPADTNGNFTWTNGAGTGLWEDADNWDRDDYPKDNEDYAIFNATNVTNCNTNGSNITVGDINIQSGYTGTLTINGTLEVDTAGSLDGCINISNGAAFNASTFNISSDGMIEVNGTFIGGSGTHTFGAIHILDTGIYNATSGTTYLTNRSEGYAGSYMFVNKGIFNHEHGTIESQDWGSYNDATNLVFNNFIMNHASGSCPSFNNAGGATFTFANYTQKDGCVHVYDPFIITGDMTIEDGRIYSTSPALTVSGMVNITGATAEVDWNTSGVTVTMGSLLVASSGTYDATNGITNITSTTTPGVSSGTILNLNTGILNHNLGTFIISYSSTANQYQNLVMASVDTNNKFYNLKFEPVVPQRYGAPVGGNNFKLTAEGTLTVGTGAYLTVSNSNISIKTGNLTIEENGLVYGDKNIEVLDNCTINDGGVLEITDDRPISFKDLTIEAGGTYFATNGTTTITGDMVLDGSIEHNNGTFNFTSGGSQNLDGNGDSLYNAEISSGTTLNITGNVVTIGNSDVYGTVLGGISNVTIGSTIHRTNNLTAGNSSNFTIIVIPDTQNYARYYPSTFTNQTQWIVNNYASLNGAFVIHLGDIVDQWDNMSQWDNANTSMSILDDNNIPYSILPGNHDFAGNNTTDYNTYFPVSRFSGKGWWGGNYAGNNDNTYFLFSAGGMEFIVVSLQWNPNSSAIAWANEVLTNYSTRRGIVATHMSLGYVNLRWNDPSGGLSGIGNQIYNGLENCSNLFLILNGHTVESAYRLDINNGNPIHQVESNYQDTEAMDSGYLRIMEFIPSENLINISTYSTLREVYNESSDVNNDDLYYYMGGTEPTEKSNLTVSPTGVYNASNGTTQITGNTLINGTWNTPNNATINMTNVTHNGTTNAGDYATWHLYGEWGGYGTLNGFSSPNRATIIAYNNSKIMGTLDGNSEYIYEFIIPEGEIVEKYGSKDFGAHTGKLEINGTYNGTRYLLLNSLGANIFIGPNANVSTITLSSTSGSNTIPESTWGLVFMANGGTLTFSGNITVAKSSAFSYLLHYSNTSKSTLDLNGYSLTATGSSHDLRVGHYSFPGDEGFAGVITMDGGSITGFDDISVYTKNSTINDTGAGAIEAANLYLIRGNITLNETIVNITDNLDINSTFTGGSGSHYLNNLTIDLDGEYAGAGNLTFTGTAQITNGSLNNFTITNMNNTRAWFYNSTDIQLHSWTSLPASSLVNITGKAVNISNTSVSSYTDLNISYTASDISGLNESSLKIYRYNGTEWEEAGASTGVNTTNNYTWAKGITEFSEFVIGGEEGEDYPQFFDFHINETLIGNGSYARFNLTVNDTSDSISYVNGTINNTERIFSNTSLTHWYYDYLCNETGLIQWSHVSANDSSDNWNNTAVSNINFTCDVDVPQFSSPAINESTIATNEYFCINITITDGTSAINTAYAEINNTTSLVNYTLSNSTSIANCGGGGNTWSAQIQATTNGTWNYSKVWANDSVNNANTTDFADLSINAIAPKINIDWIYPASNINATQYEFFNVTVNVTCLAGNCGEINTSLDPTIYTTSDSSLTAIGAHHLDRLSDGTLVVAFTDVNDYGMIGNSTDNGTTWNTETVINADVVGSYQGVSMVVDSNDVIWYFFINQSDKDLYYVNGTFGSWSSPVNITSSTINGPDTAIDSNDIIHVAYSDMGPTPDENKYVTSNNWSNPYTLHTSGDDRQYPHIDIDSNDIPHIILAAYADGDLMYYNKTGGSWSSATVINDAAYDMRRGNIEIDDQDRVHAVYSQDIGSNYYVIGYKYKNESSGWSSATTIADKGSIYDQITPTCRLDNSNRLWIFWAGDGWELHHAQKQICYKYLNLTDWTWDSPGSSNATCITNYQEVHAVPVLMESYQIHDGMAVAYIWQDYSGGDDYLFFNTTSGIQWDSSIKSGLIPFGSGAPFYTNRSNPNSTSFNENDSYTITWWVNATGEADTTHEFYVYANRTADMSQNNITSKLNVTITSNVAPTITNAIINDSSAVAQYTIVKVNASVTDADYDLDNVTLEITPPISPAYNTTPSNDTPSHFYNDTINLTEKGRWLFGFRANDTQGNNAALVLAQDLTSNYFIDVEPEANITVVYPYSNESVPIDTSSVEINITTDYNADCEWNDTDINFAYGTGTDFTNGQGATQHSFTKSGLINGEDYVYYYKCNTTSFGSISSQSTVHNFSVYNDSLKITSNSVRLYASGSGVLDTYVGFRYLFDSRLDTNFTSYDTLTWNDTTTFYMNFILPDRSGTPYEGIRNFSVSYFRYRCPALDGCPDKFDVYADNTLILVNKTVTPTANTWINIDVPDTNFTANSGSFIWVIKGVNGTGSQRIVISDIEIFSTEFTEYTSQSTQTGFVEIPMWWNNLQWAHTFRIDDVCNVTWTVNNTEAQLSPLKQPLTLVIWGNDTTPLCDDGVGYPGPDYGNSTEITNKGHEYATHSYDDAGGSPYAAGYSYFQAVTWANESRKDIEDNVYNTSRWSNNTILTFGYPGSKVNYHGTEAIYDAGFRVADSINSAGLETNANGYASIHTSWQGYAGGINTTRDEKDWLQFIRVSMAEGTLVDDFEEKWNWTRDNGLLGDMIKHCYGVVHCTTINQTYLNVLGNDTVGWHATQGEVRSYYYYYQHMNLTYNSSASTGTSKIYDVHVHYENNQDRGRIWRVPVTFGFNITEIGFSQSSVVTYLENDLGLVNISSNQTMAEGYKFNTTEYTGTTMLYLSVKKDDGDQINITGALAPKINIDWIYPTDNLSMPKYEFFNVSVNVTCLKNTCGAINTTIAHNESDINITAGATPFYTNMSNPNSTSFNENDSYVITWWVNTTGTPGTVWPFFAYANRTADMSQNNITTPSYYITIQQPKAIAIDLSATLTNGIRWNITNLSIAQHSALGNNQSGTDNQTAYNITIIAQSCTADLYVNATGDLASGVDTIGLPNETYSYNLTDRYVPSDNKTSLNTSYQLITSGISSQTVHFKFYLNVTSGQAAGTYKNNLTFKVVEVGASP